MSEPDRSSEGLVFVSTGRRLAAAKVGRRWHEVRGPLMIAAALASIQALLLFVVLPLRPLMRMPVSKKRRFFVACVTTSENEVTEMAPFEPSESSVAAFFDPFFFHALM